MGNKELVFCELLTEFGRNVDAWPLGFSLGKIGAFLGGDKKMVSPTSIKQGMTGQNILPLQPRGY